MLPSPKKMQLAADNSNLVEEVETSGDEHGKSFSKIFHKVSSTYITYPQENVKFVLLLICPIPTASTPQHLAMQI